MSRLLEMMREREECKCLRLPTRRRNLLPPTKSGQK